MPVWSVSGQNLWTLEVEAETKEEAMDLAAEKAGTGGYETSTEVSDAEVVG